MRPVAIRQDKGKPFQILSSGVYRILWWDLAYYGSKNVQFYPQLYCCSLDATELWQWIQIGKRLT